MIERTFRRGIISYPLQYFSSAVTSKSGDVGHSFLISRFITELEHPTLREMKTGNKLNKYE